MDNWKGLTVGNLLEILIVSFEISCERDVSEHVGDGYILKINYF